MAKKIIFTLLILLAIDISSAFSGLSPKFTPQFLPRIQAESSLFKEFYKPARILIKINSNSPGIDDLLEDLENSTYIISQILSKFLFAKSQTQTLKLGEKNLCDSIFLENYMIGDIEADLVVFLTISDNSMKNSTSFKVCEISEENQLDSIEIKADQKIFEALNENQKVNLLSKGIIKAIFNEESKNSVKYLEESLDAFLNQLILEDCQPPCSTCVAGNDSQCATCELGYWMSGNVCLPCSTACIECVSNTSCSVCLNQTIQVNHMCICKDPNSYFDTQLQNCVCKQGYYFNEYFSSCSSCGDGCNDCIDPLNCTSCYDSQYASVINGTCECNDKNAKIYPETVTCSCNPGFYNSSSNICTNCAEGCSSCTGDNNCEVCFDQSNMKLNADGTCRCIDTLKVFSPQEEECVCKNGYIWNGYSCTACGITCASCNDPYTCATCIDPSGMIYTDGACNCRKGMRFVSTSRICVSMSGSIDLIFSWIWVLILGWISMI